MQRPTVRPMRLFSFRTLSLAAYLCSFGALWGFATYGYTVQRADGTNDIGLLYVWVVGAFIGSMLIVAKNQMLGDRRLRMRTYLTDLAVLGAALVLIAVLPSYIGMVKGLVLLALIVGYWIWYSKALGSQLSA